MKKNLYLGILGSVAAAGLLTACSGDEFSMSSSMGGIKPVVGLDTEVKTAKPQGRAAATVTVDELSLRLQSADGSVKKEWSSVSEFDNKAQFRVGTYTMEAYKGSLEEEGFDSPYYYGSTTLEVEENKTTPVALTAKLANSMVSVTYTEAFLNYFSSYGLKIHSEGGAYIDYAAGETRAVYVRPGKVTIIADIVKQNGVSATLEAAVFTAKPQYHHTVTLDVNGGNAGDAQLVITYDDTIEEKVEEIIDLSDELLNAPAPELIVDGFEPATIYSVVSGMKSTLSPKFKVIARGGISSVVMTTESKTLAEQGWVSEIDLANSSAAEQGTLQSLGLKAMGLFGNVDKMAVVDLSGVMEHLLYRENGNNNTKITITVKDKNGKVTEPVSLNIAVEPIELTITEPSPLYYDDETLEFILSYNGDNVAENVKFSYLNERGTYSTTELVSATPMSRTANNYNITVKIPADLNPVKLVAECMGFKSELLSVDRVESKYKLAVNNNDAYAKHVFMQVLDSEGQAVSSPADATIEISTGGEYNKVNFTSDGNYVKVAGLEPSTEYKARVVADNLPSPAVTFTTEAIGSIPDSNMDAWGVSESESNWKREYVGSSEGNPWGTANALTTSQGGNYAYVRISGTTATEGRSGNCALLRTIGWGSGNTATGSKGTSGICKYTDAGLLHLGAGRSVRPAGYGENDNKSNKTSTGPVSTDDLDCGMVFESRPSSLGFWYKYSPKNSADKGYAEIWVKDAAGNIISKKTMNLESASDWTKASLPLEYAKGCNKGAKIYVKFLSSYDMEYIKRTDANFSGPGFTGNLGKGTFMGSQLWIDDISLEF